MKAEIIKVHTKEGEEIYLNPRYVVRFQDQQIIVDDYAYDPNFKMPESKHKLKVFETSNEIFNRIDGKIAVGDLDVKYADEFEKAKKEYSERCPW